MTKSYLSATIQQHNKFWKYKNIYFSDKKKKKCKYPFFIYLLYCFGKNFCWRGILGNIYTFLEAYQNIERKKVQGRARKGTRNLLIVFQKLFMKTCCSVFLVVGPLGKGASRYLSLWPFSSCWSWPWWKQSIPTICCSALSV